MGLKASVDAVWTAALALLNSKVQSEQSGVQVYEWGEFYARRASKAIVVLSRVVDFSDEAVLLTRGDLAVVFGCMAQNADISKGKEAAEDLGFWLAEMFQTDQFLGNVARDTRIDSIELDFEAPEPVSSRSDQGESQQWVGVTVVWELEYSKP